MSPFRKAISYPLPFSYPFCATRQFSFFTIIYSHIYASFFPFKYAYNILHDWLKLVSCLAGVKLLGKFFWNLFEPLLVFCLWLATQWQYFAGFFPPASLVVAAVLYRENCTRNSLLWLHLSRVNMESCCSFVILNHIMDLPHYCFLIIFPSVQSGVQFTSNSLRGVWQTSRKGYGYTGISRRTCPTSI